MDVFASAPRRSLDDAPNLLVQCLDRQGLRGMVLRVFERVAQCEHNFFVALAQRLWRRVSYGRSLVDRALW